MIRSARAVPPDSGLFNVRKVQTPTRSTAAITYSAGLVRWGTDDFRAQMLDFVQRRREHQRAEHHANDRVTMLLAEGGPRFRLPRTRKPSRSRSRDRVKCMTLFHVERGTAPLL